MAPIIDLQELLVNYTPARNIRLTQRHLLECPVGLYAVKVQRSVAPLSRFRGSHILTAHEQECCRFQSYANSACDRL